MNQWFTSDTHFGHENIIKFSGRPFASVKEMNEALLTYWNETVGVDDVVYHLGDVAMGHFDDSWEYVKKLHGNIYLVNGNHDRVSRKYHMSEKYVTRFSTRYIERFIAYDYEMRIGDWKLHHFPYLGDHVGEERFKNERPVPTYEKVLIHGHVHEEWRERTVPGYPPMFNVGVDVRGFRPVHRDALSAEIAKGAS
jgi:calcineurin-like phosphoesterase family protein